MESRNPWRHGNPFSIPANSGRLFSKPINKTGHPQRGAIAEFQSNVTSLLSDIYAEIQQERDQPSMSTSFVRFRRQGQKIEKDILNRFINQSSQP